ncbi:MAG: hypothetical protein ACK58M_03370 [Acidobacteriota bacterium]
MRLAKTKRVFWGTAHNGLASARARTATSEAELRHGLALLPPGRRHNALQDAIDGMLQPDFLGRIPPFDPNAAPSYAAIAADRRSASRPIRQFDCQIATIACAWQAAPAP